MKEKTIQQEIFKEIRRRDGITYADIAEKVGITEDGVFSRMKNGVGFTNFVQMIQACGYDITISKARPGQEPGIHYGESACDSCCYKQSYEQMRKIVEDIEGYNNEIRDS